ncbi:disease resistance protein RPS2-like [Carex rostrata]
MSDSISLCSSVCECLNAIGVPAAVAAEFRSFFVQDNWFSLKTAKENLQAVQTEVNTKVDREIERQRGIHSQVQLWLSRVEDTIMDKSLEEEYDKLEEEYDKLMLCGCNLSRRHKLGKRIIKKLEYVKGLIEEEKQFTDVGVDLPVNVVNRITVPKTFGMDSMLKQLRKYFQDHERCIIGVWGQGGAGKTTLLNEFNNQLTDCSDLHAVILIDVSNSEILNVKVIQRTIVDRLGLPWVDTDTEDARAMFLMKALLKKRFVILLDDVRKKFQLEDIGIPLPNTDNGYKIILASREQDVCIQMGAQHNLIKMELLDDQASWDLFFSNLTNNAQRSIKSSYSIKRRAEAITKSCQGLPLAINVISCAVAGLKSSNDWRDAMTATKMGLGEIGGVAEQIFKPLKYSYDKLDSTTKKCFLYCTLFPEYSSIKKEQLVDYWIAEGFIPSNQPWKGSWIIIKKLISACLLQETNSGLKVRLHNIIRHFGLWLARQENNFLVQSGQNLESPPDIEQWNGPERISLMSNDIKDLSFSPKCINLETLLLQNNLNLTSLSPKFFKSMKNLKILDLSNTGIKELPECDELCQLQHLNLSQTPIIELPGNFSVLGELRYLDLSLTKALKETHDNCSKLLKLRVLNLFRSHYGIHDVSNLNLDTLKELKFLGITICTKDVLKKLKKTDPLAKSTHRLSLTDCPHMKSIHGTDFNQMVHLQELYIESCPKLSELVMDQDDGGVSNLQVLTLWNLPNLDTILVKSLPHYFRRLRELTIYECHKLENLNWVERLESLEKLIVSRCNGMVHLSEKEEHGMQIRNNGMSEKEQIQTLVEEASEIKISENKKKIDEESAENIDQFPKLRSVILSDMENLVSICSPSKFPSLETIRVQNCPNLVRLPVSHGHKIIKLWQIRGSSEWWNTLEWDNMETKSGLEKYFMAI